MIDVGCAKPKKVLRGIWFWFSDENTWIPYENDSADILEAAYRSGVFLSDTVVFPKKPVREVRLHIDGSFKQYRRGKNANTEGRPVQRGYKGRICKIHSSFSQFAPYSNQMFGLQLEVVMKHPLNNSYDVPCIISLCIEYIMKEVKSQEELFIEKALPSQVQELKDTFNSGYIVDFSGRDLNTIAEILRLYLETIPEPVSTNSLSDSWLNLNVLMSKQDQFIENVKSLFNRLPLINQLILIKLLRLFNDLCTKTKTSVTTICEKWAVSIFRTDLFTTDSIREILKQMIILYNIYGEEIYITSHSMLHNSLINDDSQNPSNHQIELSEHNPLKPESIPTDNHMAHTNDNPVNNNKH